MSPTHFQMQSRYGQAKTTVIGLKQKHGMKHGMHPEIWEKMLILGAYHLSHVQSLLGNFSSEVCDLQSSIVLVFAGMYGCRNASGPDETPYPNFKKMKDLL